MINFNKSILAKAVQVSLLMCIFSNSVFAVPTDFDFSGTFENDNDVLLFDFTVEEPSEITIFSSSWQGFDTGLGFDPILALWSGEGMMIEQQDDGGREGTTASNGVDYSHGVWDSFFSKELEPGDYIASVVQYDNFARSENLEDGFIMDDDPNFTRTAGFGDAPNFNDADGDARTGDWEFHILNVNQAGATQNGEDVGTPMEPEMPEMEPEMPGMDPEVIDPPVISIPPTMQDPVDLDPVSDPAMNNPAGPAEVPEPASVVLLISGIVGLALHRKRQTKS